MEPTTTSAPDFISLGLSEPILAALTRIAITVPSPIQAQAIPIARTGQDLMGIAETGTGKTFAFSLPIIERFLANPQAGKAVIVVPTRELALQVEENIRKVTRLLQPALRTACLIGGAPMYRQVQDLRANPRIIIGTPGRMWDHMQQKNVRLNDVSVVVLDEADRMLDMGFAPQIKRILEETPASRQTMCFSATMAPEIAKLAGAYMRDPKLVKVASTHASNKKIEQELAYMQTDDKNDVLHKVLSDHEGRILVFTRTKFGAKRLAEKLRELGHTSAEIHSNRSLAQRRQALDGFKIGRHRVLVATDVAARGIDVQDIELVVNFDLPDVAEDYVHRIGRTGRASRSGKAISFATPNQVRDVRFIERLLQGPLPVSLYNKVEVTAGSAQRGGSYDRPRPSYGQNRPSRPSSGGYGSSRPSSGGYGSSRPSSGERPSFGDRSARPSFGDRPSRPTSGGYKGSHPRPAGESSRPSFGDRSSRPSSGGHGSNRPTSGGYNRSRPQSGERSAELSPIAGEGKGHFMQRAGGKQNRFRPSRPGQR